MQRLTATRAAKIAGLVTAGTLAALVFAVPALAADAPASATGSNNLIFAALVGVGYYLSNSPWLFGNGGFFGFYRPLVAGLVVGILYGDPAKGAEIGAAINLLYIGFISAGGSIPADPSVAGWVGTALALSNNLDSATAISLGVAIGLLGTVIFFTRMSVDAIFAHWADAAAERGDIGGVARMNWLPPQIFLFIITFLPAFVAVYVGSDAVGNGITWLNDTAPWVLKGFEIAGSMLPAIGIALNMRFIFRGPVVAYFFVGYIISVASAGGVNVVQIAIVGAALAVLHVTFLGARTMQTKGA